MNFRKMETTWEITLYLYIIFLFLFLEHLVKNYILFFGYIYIMKYNYIIYKICFPSDYFSGSNSSITV